MKQVDTNWFFDLEPGDAISPCFKLSIPIKCDKPYKSDALIHLNSFIKLEQDEVIIILDTTCKVSSSSSLLPHEQVIFGFTGFAQNKVCFELLEKKYFLQAFRLVSKIKDSQEVY